MAVMAMAATGCGAAGAESQTASAQTGNSVALASQATAATEATTTTKPATTTEPTTSTVPPPTTEPAPEGRVYHDPERSYSIVLSPNWSVARRAWGNEMEAWFVVEPQDNAGPNVIIMTESAGGRNLEEELLHGIADLQEAHGIDQLISSEIVVGQAGQPLGVIEYTTGGVSATLTVAMTNNDQAVVALFARASGHDQALRAEVYPYLMTLTPNE